MVVALKVQVEVAAWADDASPVVIGSEHDRTPAVQNELYGELLKRASAGLGAGERISHADMLSRPAELRGKIVRWEGVILESVRRMEVEPVPLAPGETPPDTSNACEAVILDTVVSGKTVAVTFLKPGPKPSAHGRIVFDGAFWKLATYTNKRGETVSAPYLVANTWELVKREESRPLLPILIGLTGGIAMASIVIGAQATRRRGHGKA